YLRDVAHVRDGFGPQTNIALMSATLSEQQLFDSGNTFIRQQLATVQGASIPQPFGGKQRQISVDLNPFALQQNNLSPVDISNAVAAQNLVLPSGSAKFGTTEYLVELNGSPQTIEEINNFPVRTQNGATLYLRDVAHVRDGFGPQTNIVRANGQRGVLMAVYKTGSASTLDIVARVRSTVAHAAESLPPELKITALFDQSIFVRAAVQDVMREALIAAVLTALMILIFLGDWRSTMIISVSIPLSIMVSLITLAWLGETINIMTLGGLALAVGILVDDASVTIENIDRNLAMGKSVRDAILDGSQQIVVPAFVSTLCICIVFVPMFFLTGVARYLFVPLAEAVIFAMMASFLLSRTLVPTLAMYLLDREHALPQRGFERAFDRFREGYRGLLETAMHHRKAFIGGFAVFCAISVGYSQYLGRDFFPEVDAGQIRLHLRARSGLRIEETARLTDEVEAVIRKTVAAADLATVLDNIGLPTSGLNLSLGNTGTIGSSDAEVLVQLTPERTTPTKDYIRTLRATL
ncbi:MAG: efflux RND transporter permease subunit, partial [Acidobacteriota bacterium]